MKTTVSQIPFSSIPLANSVSKAQANTSQPVNASSTFKSSLLQKSGLTSQQAFRLLHSQTAELRSDSDKSKNQPKTTLASSLLPFLLNEFQLLEKTKSKQHDPLATEDGSEESKIQALNELIEDFDIEEDTDFMDLSRWVMDINNEMSIDD